MDKQLEQEVRSRAGELCEYCHSPQQYYPERFQIDHIIARQHGGVTVSHNLALCCLECNRRKGPNITNIDPETGQIVPLFNPRTDSWNDHFRWTGGLIVGQTPIGRATSRLLMLNRAARVVVRQALIEEGRFPPAVDVRAYL